MVNDFSNKTETENRWVMLSVFLSIVLVVLVSLSYWLWQRNQTPISIINNQFSSSKINNFDDCFNSEGTTVQYAKNFGDPAICFTADGQEFIESVESYSKRYQGAPNAYGPVESWQVYRNEKYGFQLSYPEARYDLLTQDLKWNPSAMILRNKENSEFFYSFAVETPISDQDALNRFGNESRVKLVETDAGYVALVILDDQDPYLPLIVESFKQF